jgi:hypothetical protein
MTMNAVKPPQIAMYGQNPNALCQCRLLLRPALRSRAPAANSINNAGQLPDWRDAWFTQIEDFDHRQGRTEPCRIWMRVPKNHH